MGWLPVVRPVRPPRSGFAGLSGRCVAPDSLNGFAECEGFANFTGMRIALQVFADALADGYS